jgi:imidazolonepropionase-like amidohydrolase
MKNVVLTKDETVKIPPFKDSHIHFTVDGRPAGEEELIRIAENLVASGILCVNDMGYKTGLGIEAKEFLKDRFPLLTVRTAGYAIYKKGTYGVFLGKGISKKDEISKTVKEIAAQGADFIKLVNSGIVSAKGGLHVTPGGFGQECLKIICAAALDVHLNVSCHVNGDEAIRDAVTAGVSSIEHGFFVSKETLHMMKESDVSWTPTVFAFSRYSETLGAEEKYLMDKMIEEHLAAINYAAFIGVKLNVGTDSGANGIKHGESFFEELKLFKKAGLTQKQALKAACVD